MFREYIHQKNSDSEYQEQVNKGACYVKAESQQPKNQQCDKKCPGHLLSGLFKTTGQSGGSPSGASCNIPEIKEDQPGRIAVFPLIFEHSSTTSVEPRVLADE